MKNQFEMTSPCGLACHACILNKASYEPQLAEQLAKKHNFTSEQMQCSGCRNHKGSPPIMRGQECETYVCITEKGHSFCYECAEFPCERLAPCALNAAVLPHNTKIYNLLLIKRDGLEVFSALASEILKRYFQGEFMPGSKIRHQKT